MMSENDLSSLRSQTASLTTNFESPSGPLHQEDRLPKEDVLHRSSGSNVAVVIVTGISISTVALLEIIVPEIDDSPLVSLMELINQSLPTKPDLDGLLKPPRIRARSMA